MDGMEWKGIAKENRMEEEREKSGDMDRTERNGTAKGSRIEE